MKKIITSFINSIWSKRGISGDLTITIGTIKETPIKSNLPTPTPTLVFRPKK